MFLYYDGIEMMQDVFDTIVTFQMSIFYCLCLICYKNFRNKFHLKDRNDILNVFHIISVEHTFPSVSQHRIPQPPQRTMT